MKKAFLWIVMVLLCIALLVGGTIGLFYWRTSVAGLPDSDVSYGGVSLGKPVGYQWDVPVFWGASKRRFEEAPSLSVEKLGKIESAEPALAFPGWVTNSQLIIKNEAGEEIFSGTADEYAKFRFEENGDYTAVLTLTHSASGEKPAQSQGWYRYNFKFTLSAAPTVEFSKTSVAQGSVIGVKVSGALGSEAPQGSCDLGSIWFSRSGNDWLGYLPVAFNADAGKHNFTVTASGHTLTQELEVTQKNFAKVDLTGSDPAETPAAEASAEYRSVIWPFYSDGSLEKQWLGAFSQPVKGDTVQDYGVYLVNGTTTTRSSDLTLAVQPEEEVVMPSDGKIVYVGALQLGGNTVVIDHGCGLKTYIYGLGEIYVSEGQTLLQKEAIGKTGEDNITIEMRIGNKSISPWDAWRGNGGLFFS